MAVPLVVATLPQLLVATAAVVATVVVATATHLALAATLGGKSVIHRFTISPVRGIFSLHDTLGFRAALQAVSFHFLQFRFFLFLRIFPGYRGSMRKSGILYPNQHIDSDCFSGSAYFELFSHTIPFDASPSSSSIDGRTVAFPGKACITNISRLRSFCKHAAWGAIDSRFPSHPHADGQ